MKRLFELAGEAVHHLNKPKLVPVHCTRIHMGQQVGEDFHGCRWQLSVRKVPFVLEPSLLHGLEHLALIIVL